MRSSSVSSGGIGLGSVIAAILSFSVNHSILWALLHGLCGWLYVCYYLLGGCR
jgi:hypothetical protein